LVVTWVSQWSNDEGGRDSADLTAPEVLECCTVVLQWC
jgi:hypothetical protein